ncbi:MAG TPA: ABC transporter permease subunit [Acidimicrobiia bacterium]|nr:ABC transporter permease subunit [Acidimicrobiia bacterium]
MQLHSLAAKTVHDRRHGLVWWSVGMAVLTLVTLSVWPSVRDEYSKLLENYPKGLLAFFGIEQGSLGTASGYLQAELFGLMVPLTFTAYMIAAASGTIAGEEEAGTLGLLLAYPIARRRVVLEKFGALCGSLAVITVAFACSLIVFTRVFALHVAIGHLLEATFAAYLLGVLYGAIALLAGVATGHRALAAGVASATAVAGYLLTSLAGLVDGLKPFRPLSPFWWYSGNNPLLHGLSAVHISLLVATVVVSVAAGAFVFDRRDVAS